MHRCFCSRGLFALVLLCLASGAPSLQLKVWERPLSGNLSQEQVPVIYNGAATSDLSHKLHSSNSGVSTPASTKEATTAARQLKYGTRHDQHASPPIKSTFTSRSSAHRGARRLSGASSGHGSRGHPKQQVRKYQDISGVTESVEAAVDVSKYDM
jgi:hypothetical protein